MNNGLICKLSMSAVAITFLAATPRLEAGFVFFNLPGAHAGQSARVAEQIVCANVLCTGLDYQFFVLNTGAVSIDGVAFGLGVNNAAAQIAGGALTLASANGGGDGPFPNVAAGNFGGTAVLGIPAGGAPVANGPNAWGFEEWQDAPGVLPASFYIVRWYSPVQGFNAAKLFPNRWARLDLFTVFGPAGGTGGVDPPDVTLPFFGFDTVNDEFNVATAAELTGWTRPCDPANASENCTDATLADLSADTSFGAASQQDTSDFAPEPASVALAASGFLGLAVAARRRRSN